MNDGDTAGSTQKRRPGLRRGSVLAAPAGIALLAAACGGGSPAAAGSNNYQKAVAYAQCMRANGELSWPDPDSQGAFVITANLGYPSSPQYLTAGKACRHLLPSGDVGPPQSSGQTASQALKTVNCFRAHGYPDFPDPVLQNGSYWVRFPTGIDHSSRQFQAAFRACGG
jgi:hypothetical protein